LPAAPPRPALRDVIRRFGLSADKRLGQHFLLDPQILARIARAAEPLRGQIVLEVGPGPGGLTGALLDTEAEQVIAVEQDQRCVQALAELALGAGDRLRLIEGDARRLKLTDIAADRPITVVANLPYNVGTELLIGWLHQIVASDALSVRLMVLMFQREVARRLRGAPGEADWGRLGVLAQAVCRVERLFDLPAAAFVPPPQVASSLVRLEPRVQRPTARETAALEQVTRAAFGQRRKMLKSSLKAVFPRPEEVLPGLGIDPTRRAETLTLDEFLALARLIEPAS
jgi:16S rRNA (adenine1518-N6/adenine1519-N6)-dimethyltransferase